MDSEGGFKMTTLRYPVAGFVLFMVFIGLFITIYTGMEDQYGIVRDTESLRDGLTIAEKLDNLLILDGINTLITSVTKLTSPRNPLDVLGALASAGFGIAKTFAGILSFPMDILNIFLDFYPQAVPPNIQTLINMLVGAYIAFIILSALLRHKL